MFNVLSDLNWFAVVVSTVTIAALGGLYFTVLVAKPYQVALGNEGKETPPPGPLFLVCTLVANLLVVLTSAVLLRVLEVDSVGDSIAFGLIVGIGYLVAQTTTIAFNPNFPRPLLYTLINAPFFVISAVGASIILTQWS